MPAHLLLLKNAEIINEGKQFSGDLLIENGLIAKVFNGGHKGVLSEENCKILDIKGKLLIPGVIDDQVHFREPGLTHKADIFTESRAAIAGGITSFMEMPNTIPQTTTQKLLEDKFRVATEKSLANYSFYIGATNNNLDELRATDPKHVCGIKIFLGSSTGNMLVDDPATLSIIFRDTTLPIAVHCEDETTIRANMTAAKALYGKDIPMHMHAAIRSHDACEISSRMAIGLALKYDTRLHLLHLSTAGEMKLLENQTPLKEKRITAEACVHHLWFSMDDYFKKGSLIKWNPAIKYESDRKALIDAIREGYIDVVATDHAPHTKQEKQNEYALCPSGGPMVQHALPAMLDLAEDKNISYSKIVELMCHNPAICLNVRDRGFIREGYAADLVVVDPKKKMTVQADNILYKCGWSPIEGTVLHHSILYTFVNGQIVYDNGNINEQHRGEALLFDR